MITNNKLFFYLKLLLIFVLVYFICSFLIRDVFLANSPTIRPNVGNYLLAKIRNTNFQKSIANNFANYNSIPIAKGVSAYTKNGITYRVYELDKVEWREIKYTLSNGRQVTLRIPNGQDKLSQEDMEEMYK